MKIIKPNRVKRTYIQTINSTPDKMFPLLCPVREVDWAVGWDPSLVITESGFVEKECTFITMKENKNSYWVVSHHNPVKFEVEMYNVTPETTIGKLEIKLNEVDGKTKTTVSYSYTSLGSEGDKFINEFTEEKYIGFMKDWEDEMNHYLLTGKILNK